MKMSDEQTKQFLRDLKRTLDALDRRLNKGDQDTLELQRAAAALLKITSQQSREIAELTKFKRMMEPWLPTLKELKERLDEWKAEADEGAK